MKYYIIAGEASGDLHGSNLIKAIRKEDPEAHFRVWGGDLMVQAGGQLVKHYQDLAFMGFLEVLKNIRTILKNFRFCKEDILHYRPDVLILIDYPGFNLRMAKWSKRQEIRTFYYISPQIWAWHRSRVYGIKKNVDKMFVILPFEKEFYAGYDYSVDFVGHPLLDVIEHYQADPNFLKKYHLSGKPLIALLPGSRKQEIRRMLSSMIKLLPAFPDNEFAIAGAPSIAGSFYQEIIRESSATDIKLVENQTYDLLSYARAALVTSGTATLETALFGVPQVVCYRGNNLSYFIARHLVSVKYIALVNLIVDRPLVKELIQTEFTVKNMREEMEELLNPNSERTREIKAGYDELRQKLGSSGASARTARKIVEYLRR